MTILLHITRSEDTSFRCEYCRRSPVRNGRNEMEDIGLKLAKLTSTIIAAVLRFC